QCEALDNTAFLPLRATSPTVEPRCAPNARGCRRRTASGRSTNAPTRRRRPGAGADASEGIRMDAHRARYDVVVVGGGPVGCVSALLFAQQGRSVLLLEANPKASRRL